MRIGLGLHITGRRASGGAAAWSPADLPGLAATLLPALMRSLGLLHQDAAGTVPATEDGDPVARAECPFTGTVWTNTEGSVRPLLWDEGGGKWSFFFDGVDDYLGTDPTGVANGDFTLAAGYSAGGGIVYAEASTASTTPLLYLSQDSGGNLVGDHRDDAGTELDGSGMTLAAAVNEWHTVAFRRAGNDYLLRVADTEDAHTEAIGTTTVDNARVGVLQRTTPILYLSGRASALAVYTDGVQLDDLLQYVAATQPE